jgi:hypothetical protein
MAIIAVIPIGVGGCHHHQISLLKVIVSIFNINKRIVVIAVASVVIFVIRICFIEVSG